MALPPHTSGVRSRCAAGILHSTSCPNSSSARSTAEKFVHRNDQVSEERLSFLFYNYGLQNNAGLDIRISRVDHQHQILGFLVIFSLTVWIVCASSEDQTKGVFSCVARQKMCSSTQLHSFARFAVVSLLFLTLQRGSGATTRTCPPPCACFGELLDCSRLKRGQIPNTIPEWTVQL